MKTPRMIANHEKAVVPRQGTAAFSISTQFHQLPNRMAFPAISHGRGVTVKAGSGWTDMGQ